MTAQFSESLLHEGKEVEVLTEIETLTLNDPWPEAYPMDEAARILVAAAKDSLSGCQYLEHVRFVVVSEEALSLFNGAI